MNELIERLAREAGIRFTNFGSGNFIADGDFDESHLEAFAKAVALECANIAEGHQYYLHPGKRPHDKIRERFGL